VRRSERGGAFRHLDDIPTRDEVAGREVIPHYAAGWAELLGIERDQIARLPDRPKSRLACGPGTMAELPPPRQHRWARRFEQHTPLPQSAQNPSDHGGAQPEILTAEQDDELILSPTRVLASQGEEGFGLCYRPSGLAVPLRTMRTALQIGQVMRVIATPPTIEGLSADPEVAAGEGRVATVREIMSHPLKTDLGVTAQLPRRVRQLADSGVAFPIVFAWRHSTRVSPLILNENRCSARSSGGRQ